MAILCLSATRAHWPRPSLIFSKTLPAHERWDSAPSNSYAVNSTLNVVADRYADLYRQVIRRKASDGPVSFHDVHRRDRSPNLHSGEVS